MSARNDRRWQQLSKLAATAVALAIPVVLVVPAGLKWDHANFYDAGHKVRVGEAHKLYDSFAEIEGRDPLGTMLFSSPPLAAALVAPLSWLPPHASLVVFKLLDVLALGIALFLLYRRARMQIPEADHARFTALFLCAVLVFQPLWTIFRVGGQTTPFVLLCFVAGVGWAIRGRFAPAAAVLVLAVVLKPAFAPALAILAVTWGWRFFGWAAIFGAAAAGISIASLGWPLHQEFLGKVAELSRDSVAWAHNSGLATPIESLRLGTDHRPDLNPRPEWLSIWVNGLRVSVALLAAWLVIGALRSGVPAPARRHWLGLLAILSALSLTPIAWEHYLMLLVVPLSQLAALGGRLPGPGKVLLVAAIALGAFQNLVFVLLLWDWTEGVGAGAHFAIGLVKCAPLALTLVIFALARGAIAEGYRTPLWNAASA